MHREFNGGPSTEANQMGRFQVSSSGVTKDEGDADTAGGDLNNLERLGPEGMSDDESDVEDCHDEARPRPRRPVYRVKSPCWRATEVGEWLEVFDVVHLFERRTKPDLRGQYPRLRTRVPRVVDDEAKPVQQLPVNIYV